MSDLYDRLEQGIRGLDPEWDRADDVRRSLARRRHWARMRAGMVAGVVAISVVSVALWALRASPGHAPPPARSPQPDVASEAPKPIDVGSLRSSWAADVPRGAPLAGLLADDQNVYVLTSDGVDAFPSDCNDPCSPIWRGDIPATGSAVDIMRRQFALGEDVIFVTTPTSVFAFDTSCGSGGSTCAPIWEARLPHEATAFTGPVALGRSVRVMYSLGGEENSRGVIGAVYPADGCRIEAGSCQPSWTSDLGFGAIHTPGVVVQGTFFQQVGETLIGMGPVDCATGGASCEPVFSISSDGDPHNESSFFAGPVAVGNEWIVTAGDGNVYAFAPYCGLDCSPLWSGDASEFIDAAPSVAGDLVVVSSREGLTAFPAGCRSDGGECQPSWQSRDRSYATIEYADTDHVVAVDHLHDPTHVWVYPTSCTGSCAPSTTFELASEGQGVTSDGETLFVGTKGGRVEAFDLTCTDHCGPIWMADAGGTDLWNLTLTDQLYVGASTSDSPGEGGMRLVAYKGV
jgi:hypothetical protein